MVENIISGLIGGIIVLILERIMNKIEKSNDLKKGKIPTNANTNIILTNDIIDSISPGRNYLKGKELLGIPDKSYDDFSIFEEDINNENNVVFKSDLYFLKNAHLKITTKDEKTIDSVTVFAYEKSIEIPEILFLCDNRSPKIGEAKICENITEYAINQIPVHAIRDLAYAIQNYSGAPFYTYITYFCFDDVTTNFSTNNEKDFIGKLIEGFCLSRSSDAFYIYDYELR